MIQIVPATPEAVRAVYGTDPARSMRGLVFEEDGTPVGCAGLYCAEGGLVMFFDGNHAAVQASPKAVLRAARMLLEMADQRAPGTPVFAEASEDQPASARLLEHVGFQPYLGRVYQWRK